MHIDIDGLFPLFFFQASDIEIQAKEILFIRALLCEYIADYTGQPVDKVNI